MGVWLYPQQPHKCYTEKMILNYFGHSINQFHWSKVLNLVPAWVSKKWLTMFTKKSCTCLHEVLVHLQFWKIKDIWLLQCWWNKYFYNLSRQVFIHSTLEKLIAKQSEEVRLFEAIKLWSIEQILDSRCTTCSTNVTRKAKVLSFNMS